MKKLNKAILMQCLLVLSLVISSISKASPNITVTIDGQQYQCGTSNQPIDPDCPSKVTDYCTSKGGNLWSCMDLGKEACAGSVAGTGDGVVTISELCISKGGNMWDCLNAGKRACAGAPVGTGDCVFKLANSCISKGGNLWSCINSAISSCRP